MRLSTHRLVQLHSLADKLYAEASQGMRVAAKMAAHGNRTASRHMAFKASRKALIADRAQKVLESRG